MEEQAKVPVLKAALIYGAILGFVTIVLSLIFNLAGLSFATWTGIVTFLVSIGVLVYCLHAYRQEYLGGYAEYGKLLLMSVMIGVVASVLITLYTYIHMTFIDPDFLQKTQNFAYDKMSGNPRITEDMLDMMMERMESKLTTGRVLIQTFIGGIVKTTIIGLIVAAILKKQDPATAI